MVEYWSVDFNCERSELSSTIVKGGLHVKDKEIVVH